MQSRGYLEAHDMALAFNMLARQRFNMEFCCQQLSSWESNRSRSISSIGTPI